LGIAPAGMWMWMSLLLEEVLGDAELLGARAHEAQRRLRGLLHHVAELAGELELAGAVHARRLDEEDLAAHARPREARRATPVSAVRSATSLMKLRRAEERTQVVLVSTLTGPGFALGHLHGERRGSPLAIWRSRLRTPASRV
jgi:hypothetical protein